MILLLPAVYTPKAVVFMAEIPLGLSVILPCAFPWIVKLFSLPTRSQPLLPILRLAEVRKNCKNYRQKRAFSKKLVKILGEKKIDSLLVEGGAEIHYSALQAQIVQKIYAFVAPKIFGGHSRSPVEGEGINSLSEAYMFKLKDLRRFDDDVLMEFCK